MTITYEIVSKDDEKIVLRDIEKNAFYKIENTIPFNIKVSAFLKEVKPIFNYIYIDEEPDVLLFGIPFNQGSRNPLSQVNQFPQLLREASLKLTQLNQYPISKSLSFFELDTQQKIDCGRVLDLGDIKIFENQNERDSIQKVTNYCLDSTLPFICIGGDHSYTYDIISSFSKFDKKIIIWVLDAHNDLFGNPEKLDHGNVFFNIAQLPFVEAIIQIGARGFRTDSQLVQHPKVIQITKQQATMEKITELLEEFNHLDGYLSIDMDALDPIYFPYVDFRVPNGFNNNELIEIINLIFNLSNIKAVDIVEGTIGGNSSGGDYDIPLHILIRILNKFFVRKGVKKINELIK